MADDVNGVETAAPGQGFRDLLNAIACRVEKHDFRRWLDTFEHCCNIDDCRIDEHDAVRCVSATGRCRLGQRADRQFLRLVRSFPAPRRVFLDALRYRLGGRNRCRIESDALFQGTI